jgi:hypothetical protein
VSTSPDSVTRPLHAEIAATIAKAKLEHDPTALLLELQWAVLDRMEHLAAPRPFVMSDVDMRKLWAFARREAARGTVRMPTRRVVAVAVAAAVAASVVASVGGYALAGGFSTTCQPQQGGTICFRWTSPPTTAR